MINYSRVRWLVVPKRDDLSLTDLSWGCPVGFGGGIIMCILGLPEVVYPVGLFGIDIGSEGLCNRPDDAFSTAVCLLGKGG